MSPKDGDEVKGPTVDVRFLLEGGRIIEGATRAVRPDEGHVHVKLDDVVQSMTAATQIQLENVKPGRHVVAIEFVGGDHFPFDPRVVAAVVFRVT